MPTLPILQMSGRGNAHHLGEPQPLPMTSMRTTAYPPNPAIPGVPPQKVPAHVRKVLILRTFCPSCAKTVWYFGGIYRHFFRGYR